MTTTRQPDFIATAVHSARRFYLDLKPRKGATLQLVCGGVEHCAPGYEINRTGFRFLCVEYVARGRGSLVLAGKTHELRAGVAFAYGPRVPHRITTDPLDPLVKYFADFSGRAGAKLFRDGPLRPGRAVQVARPDEVLDIFDSLVRDGAREDDAAKKLCAVWLELLLMKIGTIALPAGAAGTPAFTTYSRCREFLESRALELHSTRELAKACHLDEAYLCRLFTRFAGVTPYQVLQRLKMKHAAGLLQAPGAMVKKVASDVSFADPYHFSRAFKRVYGMSPAAFAQAGRR